MKQFSFRKSVLWRGPSTVMVILLSLQSMAFSAAFTGHIPKTCGAAATATPRQIYGLKTKSCRRDRSLRGGADAIADDSAVNGSDTKSSSLWNKSLMRELLAELIGTFLIVQLGTGAVMSAIFTDSLAGLFQIASVWIIAVTLAICTTASISGAHLNPAVSVG